MLFNEYFILQPPKTYFITAIGTDSGKTFVSAILTEALQADYWKPIQAGLPRDTDFVAQFSNNKTVLHPETYLLTQPLSPHAAADLDRVAIKLAAIQKPATQNSLVIEGAGGLLVPINENNFVIDIAQQIEAEIILVVNFYLGSINHTLLALQELQRREQKGQLRIKGMVFNGNIATPSAEIILKHSPYPLLFSVAQEKVQSKETVKKYHNILKITDFL
jgi:dethiobiotin synthetase